MCGIGRAGGKILPWWEARLHGLPSLLSLGSGCFQVRQHDGKDEKAGWVRQSDEVGLLCCLVSCPALNAKYDKSSCFSVANASLPVSSHSKETPF